MAAPRVTAPRYCAFTLKWATLPWELAGARELRRQVFCQEQGLFDGTDQDAVDTASHTLVAVAGCGGWPDRVVGTVRIHRGEAPGHWWGSRLAVDPAFRREASLGPALIRLAVGSALGLGCLRFDACVQLQNEKLFQRLHWRTLSYTEVRGVPHVLMRAALAHYPPCTNPTAGFVVRSRAGPPGGDPGAAGPVGGGELMRAAKLAGLYKRRDKLPWHASPICRASSAFDSPGDSLLGGIGNLAQLRSARSNLAFPQMRLNHRAVAS